MSDGLHHPLGPSSFERVEACPSSAILGAGMDPVPASAYAAEGSCAHALMQWCLMNGDDAWEYIGETAHGIEIDSEMADHIQRMVDYIRGLLAKKVRPHVELEVRLELPGTPIFGTCDGLMPKQWPLYLWDLKYGAGVEVDGDTPQVGMYALMAVLRAGGPELLNTGDQRKVLAVTDVLQPRSRVSQFKRHQWTRRDLQNMLARVHHLIARVNAREMRYRVGDHCQFCPVVPYCPAMLQTAKDAVLAQIMTNPEVEYSATQLDEAFALIEPLKLWMNRVLSLTHEYLEAGGELKNAKLVAKRAVREWKDHDEALMFLTKHLRTAYQPQKMLSPAMAEKELPAAAKAELGQYVKKESTGFSVAAATDPKPAIDLKGRKALAAQAKDKAKTMISKAKRNMK